MLLPQPFRTNFFFTSPFFLKQKGQTIEIGILNSADAVYLFYVRTSFHLTVDIHKYKMLHCQVPTLMFLMTRRCAPSIQRN